jgi:hypothetical protein
VSDDAAFAEAFKLKARQLLELLSGQSLPPAAAQEIHGLLLEAKAAFAAGRMEDAAVLAAQALQKAKKQAGAAR